MRKEKNILSLDAIDCSLFDYLYSRIDNLKSVALEYFGTKITYGCLKDTIVTVAKALCACGVKEGDIVDVCTVSTPEAVSLFYALDMIGAVPDMIDPRTTTQGIHEYLSETGSKLVFTLDKAYPRILKASSGTSVEKIVVISPEDSLKGITKVFYSLSQKEKFSFEEGTVRWNSFCKEGQKAEVPLKTAQFDETRPSLMLHTGGTTGTAKCVLLSARNLNSIALQYSMYGFEKDQKFLDVMPPFIAYGFACGIHLPLAHQVRSILIPALEPEKLGSLLMKYKPQHMTGVPSHFQYLIRDKKLKDKDLSFLQTAGCGGDAITEGAEKAVNDFLKSHGCRYPLCKGWGMTELSSTAATNIKDNNKIGSVGLPLCFTSVEIVDPETGNSLPAGHEGEIYVNGPGVMLGYYKNETENRNVFVERKDGLRWLKTGDIGVMDEDGYLFIKSRIKRIIIRHDGFKVFPVQIENVVSICEDVDACSVVGVQDESHTQGKLPVVFMTRRTDIGDDELIGKVKKLCEDRLAEYFWPTDYVCVDALPYTPIGKIDYKALEKTAEAKRTVTLS